MACRLATPRTPLAAIPTRTPPGLPITIIHGDLLASDNVHYYGSRLIGVIDFAGAHLGTRVFELERAGLITGCVPHEPVLDRRAGGLGSGFARRHDPTGWLSTDFCGFGPGVGDFCVR